MGWLESVECEQCSVAPLLRFFVVWSANFCGFEHCRVVRMVADFGFIRYCAGAVLDFALMQHYQKRIVVQCETI